ncbi:hypothetical protein AAC387_Pa02g1775 [Persea americana]
MFVDQVKLARQAAMKVLINTKMAEGTPVQKHMLIMIDSSNELDVLGATIVAKSKVDMIFQSLPDSFNHFKINYNMNNMNLTLGELSSQLVVTEEAMKKITDLMIEKSFARSKPKGKDRKRKKKSVPKGPTMENDSTCGVAKAKDTAIKGKCFYCVGALSGPLTGSWFLGKSYKAIPEESEQDPYNYDEEINDIVSGRWLDVMKAEIKSMYSNQVWTLVDLLPILNLLGASEATRERNDQMEELRPLSSG